MRAVPLKQIHLDDHDTQMRAAVDRELVAEYTAMLRAAKGEWPFDTPVALYCDVEDQTQFWLGDGWSRCMAAHALNHKHVMADIGFGGKRAALKHALGANERHGARRTAADKRKAVLTALADGEWKEWSVKAVSELCGVTERFVYEVRKQAKKDVAALRKPTETEVKGRLDEDLHYRDRAEDRPMVIPEVPAIGDDEPDLDVTPTDTNGVVIPPKIAGLLAQRWYVTTEKALRDASAAAKTFLQRVPWFNGDLATVVEQLSTMAAQIGDCQPACVCPECRGEGCGWCRQSGYMPAWAYKDWQARKK